MKKRVLAIVLTLAVVLGLGGVVAAKVNAAANTFLVGYAKMDINPYANGKDSKGGFLQLPISGTTSSLSRVNDTTDVLIDDNGDGKIDENDGLWATCMAITSKDNGETVLLYCLDLVNANKRFVNEVRVEIKAELAKVGVNIPEENIQIQGTHTHSSIDVDQFYRADITPGSSAYNPREFKLTDATGKYTGETIHSDVMYANLMQWKAQLISQMKAAAVAAVQDRKEATLSKGQVEAEEVADKPMNSVRHYTQQKQDGTVYATGTHFNTDTSMGSAYYKANSKAELSEADDTLYCLKFDFGTAADPIVLVNWRAHTNNNGTSGSGFRLKISSDYVGALNYVLESKHYRPFFMQGAAGSVGIASSLDKWLYTGYNGANSKEGNEDIDGNGLLGMDLLTNRYGKELAQVVLACLNDKNMKSVSGTNGNINVQVMSYYTPSKTWGDEFYLHAGDAAKAFYNNSGKTSLAFKYPDDVWNKTFKVDGVTKTTAEYLSADQLAKATQYKNAGKRYIVSSTYHAGDLIENYDDTSNQQVAVTAFTLGEGVAFITAPGELYDRYNSTASWDAIKNLSQTEAYNVVSAVNEWDNLTSDKVGGSYGTPFVMGYANAHIGYVPNVLAYEYNQGTDPENLAVGSYEANVTECAKGTGEELLTIYADMLECVVKQDQTGVKLSNTLYKKGDCQYCQETVIWEALSEKYNYEGIESGEGTHVVSTGGHYFLAADTTIAIKNIENCTFCLDLRGRQYNVQQEGGGRPFVIQNGGILNIMDTAGGGQINGVAKNSETNKNIAAGVIRVNEGGLLNLYGGTIVHNTDQSIGKGGGVYVAADGTFNMYGGTVEGATITRNGGAVYVQSGGNFAISGGTITSGTLSKEDNINPAGPCVYVDGNMTVKGAPSIDNVYLPGNDRLTINGLFHGNMEITYKNAVNLDSNLGLAGTNARIVPGSITIENSDLTLRVMDRLLVTAEKTAATGVCKVCGAENCTIIELDQALWNDMKGYLGSNHYKLTENINVDLGINGILHEYETCLDMNGYTMTCTGGRMFQLLDNASLQIGDSSQGKTGKIITAGLPDGVTTNAGGLFVVNSSASLKLSNITVEMIENTDCVTSDGGIIYANGRCEIRNCTITGGSANNRGGNLYCAGSGKLYVIDSVVSNGYATSYGGNIYAYGQLFLGGNSRILGGTVTNSANGYCISVGTGSKSKLTLSGNATAQEIRFGDNNNRVVIDGDYSGTAALRLISAAAAENVVIGSCTGNIDRAVFTIVNKPNLTVVDNNGQLVVAVATNKPVVQLGDQAYYSMEQALENYQSGDVLVLLDNVAQEQPITKDMTVDLNGYAFNVPVAQGVTLVCKDTMTDDYDVTDNIFGKAFCQEVTAAEGYLKYTHEDGGISFHKVQTRVESAYCRPSVAGIYYGSTFKGDSFVAEMVDSFGVALSIIEDPMTADGPSAYSLSTVFTQDKFKPGNSTQYASTILTDILDANLGVFKNKENGEKLIYARSYIKLTDGSYIWSGLVRPADGSADGITLKMILEYASANWDGLEAQQKIGLMELYGKFRLVMDKWATGNIKAAYYAQ